MIELNPQAIMEMLDNRLEELSKKNNELSRLGIKKAETESAYRIALRKEILKLKMDKQQTTLVRDLSRGNEEISKLRVERDIAESSYYTCISAIENLRIEIDILRSKLTWLRVELGKS